MGLSPRTLIGIGCPEVRPSGLMTDKAIISELSPSKEEAGMVHGVVLGFLKPTASKNPASGG